MKYDTEAIRERISMRDLFERAGVQQFNKAGKSYTCCCPFHAEKTASCHIHEEQRRFYCFGCGEKGDAFAFWGRIRGVDFKGAVQELASIAGVSESHGPLPVKPMVRATKVEEDWFPPALGSLGVSQWVAGVKRLADAPEEVQAIAQWRGFRADFVEWLVGRELIGLMPYYGVQRIAFGVRCPLPEGDEAISLVGVHVRLAPESVGNLHPKQSWRYIPARSEAMPRGVGAWPFVVGNPMAADILFITEGQWDACALIDLMQWDKSWPPRIAVVGLRGASSWPLFLRGYRFAERATAFAIADADVAGKAWFEKDGFLAQLGKKVHRVHGFFPQAPGIKDFNDLTKRGLVDRLALHALFLKKMQPVRGKIKGKNGKRESFLAFCKRLAGANTPTGRACGFILSIPNRPMRPVSLRRWVKHWGCQGVSYEQIKALVAAYDEWKAAL